MRLAPPCLRHAPALALLLAVSGAHAALEYRAKADGAGLYRTEALEPPPLAALEEGEVVVPVRVEADRSLVRTSGGLQGWMRNRDLVKVRLAAGSRRDLDAIHVDGMEYNHSELVLDAVAVPIEVQALHRDFAGEVVETVDREQVEMRHDEH